jgi:hypothetical protein
MGIKRVYGDKASTEGQGEHQMGRGEHTGTRRAQGGQGEHLTVSHNFRCREVVESIKEE